MKIRAAHRRQRRLIGLTPLIDVVFILLFFFMLASSLQNWQGIRFQLAGMSSTMLEQRNTLRYVVHPGARIERDGERLELAAFAGFIESQPPDRLLVLVPAPETPLQDLVSVVDAAELAGLKRIIFGTRP